MSRLESTVMIEDARLVFRNFSGIESMYNREGDRNFSVILDEKTAHEMSEDGWNVKTLKAREEDAEEQPYIQVSVGYKGRPPRVVMITSRGRSDLGEDEVELLDWVDILKADLIVRPYTWAVGEKTGVKAYLKSIYVTIDEDPLELKYSEIDRVT